MQQDLESENLDYADLEGGQAEIPDYGDLDKPETPEQDEVEAEIDEPAGEVIKSNDEVEVVIEGESSADDDLIPAFAAKKLRRKLKSQKNENKDLQAKIDALEAQVGAITKGSKPDPLDYTDSEKFYADLEAWQQGSKPEQPQAQQAPKVDILNDDEIDSHYTRAQKLKGYEQREDAVMSVLSQEFGANANNVAQAIIKESGEKSEMVMFALSDPKRMQTLLAKMQQDAENGYQTQSATKYIWKLSEQANIKPKSKRVNIEPETIPKGKADANSLQSQIAKARSKWEESGSAEDFGKYKALKKKGMSNG